MDIPTLQDSIERRALKRINDKIKKVSSFLKYDYSDRGIFEGVAIEIKNAEGSIHPFISQLFDTEPVRHAIIEKYFEKYVKEEIEAILNPESDEE